MNQFKTIKNLKKVRTPIEEESDVTIRTNDEPDKKLSKNSSNLSEKEDLKDEKDE